MPLPKEIVRYISLGTEITAALVVPIGIGYAVDTYWDISPTGVLVGSLLGLILFFLMIIRIYKAEGKK